MYIVNTTFVVNNDDHGRWLSIIKENYIPFLKECGFEQMTFTRVISVEAVDHFTYSLQVSANSIPEYKKLTEEYFDEYLNIASPLFLDRVVWFSSLMKIVD